ncbi:hypothetical protein BDN72DRAFT_891698 [Pluteus cervinus]|uniref:Uncharacterized protein n=1 Tax=Pluteus cervinus TaxID=181527 RepID=A0ACD3BDZ0_9AGAR|nr:hypothetical protein BDN72DRAFT_891698 [Pluteus cervinus]
MADFKPRYPQPFNLAEAVGLDVSVITQEIARLEDSIRRLRETQVMLKEHTSLSTPGDVDPEITLAIEENGVVISSQEERIEILKAALREKGVSGAHYNPSPTMLDQSAAAPARSLSENLNDVQDDGGGVFL